MKKEHERISRHAPSRGRGVTRRYVLTGALAVGAGGVAWWLAWPESHAGGISTDRYGDRIQTLPRGSLPEFARSGGPEVEQVYRFAVEQGMPSSPFLVDARRSATITTGTATSSASTGTGPSPTRATGRPEPCAWASRVT
jgi:hypothetical protein